MSREPLRIRTIPGYRWVCRDCGFTCATVQEAAEHEDSAAGIGHWLLEHPHGDTKLPPARELHGSDSGWPPYVTVIMPGVNDHVWSPK